MVKPHGKAGEVVVQPVRGLPLVLSEGLSVALTPPALKRDRWCLVEHLSTSGDGALVSFSGIDSMSDEYLDSLDLTRDIPINDYTMIGFQYGVGLSQVSWNPTMQQKFRFVPVNFGFLYTRYGKMFGYMPYFGIQAGIFYGQEGYQFEEDDEGYTPSVEGATGALMQVVEVPVMAHCHFDFWKMKLMVNLGLYGGYRLSISRFGENVPESLRNDFTDTDLRFDYGIKGGAGFAFVFDPVEIHITAMYKHSFGSLYEPDYYSQYYYRYAYPTNFIFSVGVHFQLTKRVGKTKHALRQEAKEHLGLIKAIQSNVPAAEAPAN